MSSAEKDEVEIQNICLQDFGFLVILFLEHTKSNLRKHHPLCIVLLIAFFFGPYNIKSNIYIGDSSSIT
jgi:hypothetical protein